MKLVKTFGYLSSLAALCVVVLMFQNCSDSTESKKSSEVGGLGDDLPKDPIPDAPVIPDDTTPVVDPPGGADFSFNLTRGDSIMYLVGTGQVQAFEAVKYTSKHQNVLETVETVGAPNAIELSAAYCANSALPHCRHLNGQGCQGEACAPGNLAVQCSYEKMLDQAGINSFFGLLSSLSIQKSIDDQLIADCDTPNLNFYSDVIDDIAVSLAEKACVPKDKFYTSAAALALASDSNIAGVKAKGNYCNNYFRKWFTTKFSYKSRSGFVVADQASFRTMDYDGAQRANIRYKNAGDPVEYCAMAQLVDPNTELPAFFPATGLGYEVYRANVALSDAPTAEIDYSDADDGTNSWRFFLDNATAQTYSGGPIVEAAQATAIKAAVESFITRAEALNQSAACP